jgi:hypothetical protein
MALICFALLFLTIGWAAAAITQAGQPDFELIVNAPAGQTTIECVRGCNLAWVERGVNPNAIPVPEFRFSCGGQFATACSSGRVGGWIVR